MLITTQLITTELTDARLIATELIETEGRLSRPRQGGAGMLRHEELVRARLREYEREARHRRLVRRATAGRRWSWLARFAAERAVRARRAA